LNGRADVKEQAALGMGEVISLSTEAALKPSVIHITGPLIRILGDRYGPEVKIAVLDTLTLLLMKVCRKSQEILSFEFLLPENYLFLGRSAFETLLPTTADNIFQSFKRSGQSC